MCVDIFKVHNIANITYFLGAASHPGFAKSSQFTVIRYWKCRRYGKISIARKLGKAVEARNPPSEGCCVDER